MINKKRAKKALEWLRGYLRAKFGDAVQAVENEEGIALVASAHDSEVDLDEVVKSLPREIITRIGYISTRVAL